MTAASTLLTTELRDRLLANGRDRDADHVPLLKLFNPVGAATWLVTELDADGDCLFGLADLGFGCPELGSFSLAELQALRLPFGLAIERDLYFRTTHPLSAWTAAAGSAGSISEAEQLLADVSGSSG